MANMLYNGVGLSDIDSVWDKSEYANASLFDMRDLFGFYMLQLCSASFTQTSDEYYDVPVGTAYQQYALMDGVWTLANEGVTDGETQMGFNTGLGSPFWTSHDILNSDGSVYLAASEPVDPNATVTVYKTDLRSFLIGYQLGIAGGPIPIGESVKSPITWDGNTEGLESYVVSTDADTGEPTVVLYKITDRIPSASASAYVGLSASNVEGIADISDTYIAENTEPGWEIFVKAYVENDIIAICLTAAWVVPEDVYDDNGNLISSKGVWFCKTYGEDGFYTTALYFEDPVYDDTLPIEWTNESTFANEKVNLTPGLGFTYATKISNLTPTLTELSYTKCSAELDGVRIDMSYNGGETVVDGVYNAVYADSTNLSNQVLVYVAQTPVTIDTVAIRQPGTYVMSLNESFDNFIIELATGGDS